MFKRSFQAEYRPRPQNQGSASAPLPTVQYNFGSLQGECASSAQGERIPFSVFWEKYPRRVGRFGAERKWGKMEAAEQKRAIEVLELWKKTAQWNDGTGKFIPHGSTFLNQERWKDEPWTGAFAEAQQ